MGMFPLLKSTRQVVSKKHVSARKLDRVQDDYQLQVGDDHRFMARALQLARRGIYTTSPNPNVGCVIVRKGEIVGEGWHQFAGQDHAEVIALKQAGKQAAGATLYVTLEPCSHHGKTPPCVQAIIKSRIDRVVVATEDPNPMVNRGGISRLQQSGIQVDIGPGKQDAKEINRGFFKRITMGQPWVTLKTAISLDGRTAMANGESQWITGEAARLDAHKVRASSSAILTGVGTVLRDNPMMTARLEGIKRQPLRVILDSHLSTPTHSQILRTPGNVLIMTTQNEENDPTLLQSRTVEVLPCPARNGSVDLAFVMQELGKREMNTVMLEAGSQLSGNMLQHGYVDELVVYMAPDLLGSNAGDMFRLTGLEHLSDKLRLDFRDVRQIGRDLKLTLAVHQR